jgi:hypothetical protein
MVVSPVLCLFPGLCRKHHPSRLVPRKMDPAILTTELPEFAGENRNLQKQNVNENRRKT